MLTKDNVSNSELEKAKVIVFFVDVRNSTELNKKFELTKLLKIYSSFLNPIYEIFRKHKLFNIDIQGDGIYAFCDLDDNEYNSKEWSGKVKDIYEEIDNHLDNIFSEHKVKATLAMIKGTEYFSAFGGKSNEEKKLAFFGNIVSGAKKALANSSREKSKIIIHESCFPSNFSKNNYKKKKFQISGLDDNTFYVKGWTTKNKK